MNSNITTEENVLDSSMRLTLVLEIFNGRY